MSSTPPPDVLIEQLARILPTLHLNQYPEVPNPERVKKRASVALVIRINPHHEHWPPARSPSADPSPAAGLSSVEERLEGFFEQEWVRNGDPELLYIKRAARAGDRWTAQVAFPGGRRDPNDADDQAAAIRETMEEVGLELTNSNSIAVGNLPQRVVAMDWGKLPLMVLCPYVFLLIDHDIPKLRLQASEVGSAHWVPLRALISPANQDIELQDRYLTRIKSGVTKWLSYQTLGHMVFSAVRLVPSESHYSRWFEESPVGPTAHQSPLLWGLTHGVTADFLEFLPPYDTAHLWSFPTFTPWDVRFVIWVMSARFRQQTREELQAIRLYTQEEAAVSELYGGPEMSGVLIPKPGGGLQTPYRGSRSDVVSPMLERYYSIIRKAVFVTLAGRVTVTAAAAMWLWRKSRGSRA